MFNREDDTTTRSGEETGAHASTNVCNKSSSSSMWPATPCRALSRAFLARLCFWSLAALSAVSVALVLLLSYGDRVEERLLLMQLPWQAPGCRPDRSTGGVSPQARARFLSSPGELCRPGAEPFLLICVASAPEHRSRREAIRETWGGVRKVAVASGGGGRALDVRVVFVLGVTRSDRTRASVQNESVERRDIVQVEFLDTYRNLTLKTMATLQWFVSRCPGVRFLLKADDDVFVNPHSLVEHLHGAHGPASPADEDYGGGGKGGGVGGGGGGEGGHDLYLGRVHSRVRPNRDPASKAFVSDERFPGDHYAPYCSGTAYVLSGSAARKVLSTALLLPAPLLPLEDVFVGECARRAGLRPSHTALFSGSLRLPFNRCCYGRIFSSHRMEPADQRRAWSVLRGPPCSHVERLAGFAVCRALGMIAGAWASLVGRQSNITASASGFA
ncbi:beta-1,3-galactosyltransferase 4-like [Lampetra planeri]